MRDCAESAALILETLSNARRRQVVWLLVTIGEPVSVDTLAGFLAAAEAGEMTVATDRKRVRQLRNNLRHRHLDQLAAAGIIQWDERISMGPMFGAALRTLTASHSASI